MDLPSSKYKLSLFERQNNTDVLVVVRETQNNRYTFYNSNEKIIIRPQTKYKVDILTVNWLIRATDICSKEMTTKAIQPLLGLEIPEEAKTGLVEAFWTENNGADQFEVNIFELTNDQNGFVSELDQNTLLKLDLRNYVKANTLVQMNGDATSVNLGNGLVPGTPYLVEVTPIAGGEKGAPDLVKATLSK